MKPTSTPGLIRLGVLAAILAINAAHSGLVGYWNCNEGSGTIANDMSANNNDGTLAAIAAPGTVPTWIAGHTGNAGDYALGLDQGNVVVPDSASLHITNTFTMAAWVWDAGSNYGHVFSAGDASNNRKWLLQTSYYGGDSNYFWSDSGNTAFKKKLNYITPLNAWHHLAVTYDGTSMKTYGDGVLKTTINFSAALSQWATLHIGGDNVYGSGLEGKIDDMVIFNTVEDITSIMNGTHPDMVVVLTPYQQWASTKGLTGTAGSSTDPAFDADPDKDGVKNGLEWILGGLPTVANPTIVPTPIGDATTGLALNFTREEASIGQATLIVEYDTNLDSTWANQVVVDQDGGSFPNGVEVTVNQAATPDAVSVQIPVTNAPGGKIFARLRATLP